MTGRRVALYYAWSRPGETGASLGVIEDRFPTLFESRRMGFPRFEELSDPSRFDQDVAGFLDHIMKPNFERVTDDGRPTGLDAGVLDGVDTLVVISFDSFVPATPRAPPRSRPCATSCRTRTT